MAMEFFFISSFLSFFFFSFSFSLMCLRFSNLVGWWGDAFSIGEGDLLFVIGQQRWHVGGVLIGYWNFGGEQWHDDGGFWWFPAAAETIFFFFISSLWVDYWYDWSWGGFCDHELNDCLTVAGFVGGGGGDNE